MFRLLCVYFLFIIIKFKKCLLQPCSAKIVYKMFHYSKKVRNHPGADTSGREHGSDGSYSKIYYEP